MRTPAHGIVGLAFVALFWTSCASQSPLPFLEWEETPGVSRPEFRWSDPANDYLTLLRNSYALEEKISSSRSDFERVRAITHWVHGLWRHDGDNLPTRFDPISIIEEARQGQRFRCVEYAIVIGGSLKALGIPARVVGLKTRDIENRSSGAAHVVAEAYLRDEGRWVMADGQFDALPVLDGRGLNAVELQRALAGEASAVGVSSLSAVDTSSYFGWVGEYLYYFDTQLDQRGPGVAEEPSMLMLVPVGAPRPTSFQGRSMGVEYAFTESLADFYPVPTY